MATEDEEFRKSLEDMAGDLNKAGGAASDLIKALTSLQKASKEEQAAKEKESDAIQKLKERADKLNDGMGKVSGGMIAFVAGFGAVTSSVYGADKAFSSLTPTLDSFVSITGKIIEGLGKMGSGISVMGFSFGQASEGMAKIAVTGLDIVSNIVKFQLETAQKVADTYSEISKAGATFGGSINRMAMSAADAGLPIQNFGKLITTNADSLSRMGLGIQGSAVAIGQMGQNIGKTNSRLLSSYGSYDNLNNAIVEYVALQSQVGVNELKDQKALQKGATAYLEQQKELTALTGKSAETLKKEQEERRKDAAYQLALNKMGAEERLNAEYALTQIASKYGPEAAQYAKELISTGGQVFSKTGLTFEAMAGPLVDTIKKTTGGLKQNEEAFKQNTNTVMTQDAKRNADFVKNNNEFFAQMTQAGYGNEVTKLITNITAGVLAGQVQAEKAAENRAKLENEKTQGIGAASQGYIEALNTMLDQQKKLDGIVVNNMDKMAGLTKFLYEVQERFINSADKVSQVLNALTTKDMPAFQAALGNLTSHIAGGLGMGSDKAQAGTQATPSAADAQKSREAAEAAAKAAAEQARKESATKEQRAAAMAAEREAQRARAAEEHARKQAQQNMRNPVAQVPAGPSNKSNDSAGPSDQATLDQIKQSRKDVDAMANKRAAGGVAYGPTMTGEAGPEAHIPLKGGNIPMNIDFSPLVLALKEQTNLTTDMLDELRNSRDVNERILNALA